MNSENVNFFKSVIQKLQRLKIVTVVVVYEKNPKFCMRIEPSNL